MSPLVPTFTMRAVTLRPGFVLKYEVSGQAYIGVIDPDGWCLFVRDDLLQDVYHLTEILKRPPGEGGLQSAE